MGKVIKRLLIWRLRHVSDHRFMLFLSIVVGLSSGLAAVVIKNSVHFIQELLHHGFTEEYHNYLYMLYPALGISLAVLFIKRMIGSEVRHGIPNVLYAIARNRSLLQRHNMFSSVVSSALTVGFGGSVGLEGPTVSTGAALGSNVGRILHLNYKQRTLLLGCACAGAMASIFKAPIAAVVFALEVIMLDLTMTSIVPLLLASTSAVLTSYFFLGKNVLYVFIVQETFHFEDLPFLILLGIFTGFISIYFTRTYIKVEHLFERINRPYKRLLVGGSLLGLLIFLFPALYGEGYQEVNMALAGDYDHIFAKSLFYDLQEHTYIMLILLALVIFFKALATSVTFGAGGVGGVFAPTLFMGANAGLLFASLFNQQSYFHSLSGQNFALMGMAGMIAGVLHAPLTAIFLIGDITAGYQMFVPLMIVAAVSYVTVKYFQSNSVYTHQLAVRKHLITHHKDRAMLSMLNLEKLLETDFSTISPGATLGDVVKVVATSKRNVFPVVDSNGNMRGIFTLNDIRDIMFRQELYSMRVHEIMYNPEATVDINDSMEEIARKIEASGHYNIPVLDKGKYRGCLSKARVFSSYRRLLKHFSED